MREVFCLLVIANAGLLVVVDMRQLGLLGKLFAELIFHGMRMNGAPAHKVHKAPKFTPEINKLNIASRQEGSVFLSVEPRSTLPEALLWFAAWPVG